MNHVNEKGFPDRHHWPGLSFEAAEWIVKNRGLVAIGMDAISIDAGMVLDFKHSVHTVEEDSLTFNLYVNNADSSRLESCGRREHGQLGKVACAWCHHHSDAA